MASILDSIKDQAEKAKGALGLTDAPTSETTKAWPLDKRISQADPASYDNKEGVYFASSQLAHRMLNQNDLGIVGNSPFLGFQYFVKINFNSDLRDRIKFNLKGTPSVDLAPIIQSIDLPSMSVNTDKLNAYNRWRISQTKIEYEPVKMSIYDSVNGQGLGLWEAYYDFYFRDGHGTGDDVPDLVTPPSFDGKQLSQGFNLQPDVSGSNSGIVNSRYLIESIDIFQVHYNTYNQIRLHKPRISNFTHGTMSYEDSGAMKLDYTFDYEYVTYMGTDVLSESDTPDLWNHFKNSNVPSSKNPFGVNPYPEIKKEQGSKDVAETPEEQSLLDDIKNIKDPESALAALKRAKSESQEVLGAYAEAGAMFNQVQMDLTGKDEPIVKAPSVRDVSAKVNTVPTGYSDIRRSARKIRGD